MGEAHIEDKKPFGVDTLTGEPLPAGEAAIWDNYIVKRQFLNIAPVLCQQLLRDRRLRAPPAVLPYQGSFWKSEAWCSVLRRRAPCCAPHPRPEQWLRCPGYSHQGPGSSH